ncbi:unnamed protein product [Somion occarium]|uniref:DUF6534 domain-containing protein n=1 Tax=Somion occarium TaxID=3059160 RepID=A0ABP1DD42_9APHY
MATFSSISVSLGGLIESYGIGCVLYGVAVAQAYVYFSNPDRKNDAKWVQGMACFVVILETVHTGFFLRQLYFYTVLSMDNPFNLTRVDWSVPTCLVLENGIEIIVELFYIHRMWIFTRNVFMTFTTLVLLLARHGVFMYIVTMSVNASWSDAQSPILKALVVASISLTIGLEAVLTAVMVFYLYRRRTSHPGTRGIITWLITYYVNTGAILTTLSIFNLVIHLVSPTSLLYVGLFNVLAKLTANVFFGAINARHKHGTFWNEWHSSSDRYRNSSNY